MIPEPLHPAIVHFPLVLAVLAPVVVAGAMIAIRRGSSARAAWGVVAVFAAALTFSAWFAMETGEEQEERVENVVPDRPLETHEQAAKILLATSAVLLGLAPFGLARGRLGTAARVVALAATLPIVGGALRAGHTGGQLVYGYNAGSAYRLAAALDMTPAREERDERERRE